MGSFWGHMDEAIFFISISIWWMLNIYPVYIRKKGKTDEIRLPFSFGLPGKPHIPADIYYKIAFPMFGLTLECLVDGFFNFKDPDGNFQNLQNIQHMGIYGIFVIHGLTDLFLWFRWPVIKDANLISAAVAFTWYGIAFYFHAHMHGKEPLESIVHLLPLPVLFGAAACALAKTVYKEGVALQLGFTYFVFTLGTWFFHVPFMLYSTSTFPGREPSDWDRSDHRNVAFAVGIFGVHICMNAIFMWILYIVVYICMTRHDSSSSGGFSVPYVEESSSNTYQKLSMTSCDDEEEEGLLHESSVDSSLDSGYICNGVTVKAYSDS